MKSEISLIALGVVLLGACADRTVEEPWETRVDSTCSAWCDVASTCPSNGHYQDVQGCMSTCVAAQHLANEDDCGEATLSHIACLGELTCDELETSAEEDACRGELIEFQAVCSE